MAQQVKFYSVASLPASVNQNGIYFKDGGELYKGSSRFGGGRVTEVADINAAPTDAIQGDIIMCSVGGAFAYDGTKWVSIGPDIAVLKSSWKTDIKNWTSGLVSGGEGSIITGITQDAEGKVTATAIKFPEITSPADGTVSLAGTNVKISGWDALVSKDADLESRVSAIEGIVDASASKVTADTAEFKNLTVSDTATFNATTVSATTLAVDSEAGATFGGLTISAIADREALAKIAEIAEATKYSSATGVEVSVITQSGSVKDVQVAVDATSSAADIKTDAAGTKLARAKDVATAIAGLTGAMHFRGVFDSTDVVTDPQNGDIILVGTKEYVYSKPGAEAGSWVELGDETSVGNLTTYTGYDTALTTSATTLAGGINELDAKIKGMDYSVAAEADNGVKVQVTQVDGAITSVVTTVDAIESAAGITTGEGKVVTAGAVADKIANIVAGLDATVSASNKGVAIEVVENDGKLTSATVSVTTQASMAYNEAGSEDVIASTKAVQTYFQENLVWLGADDQPVEAGPGPEQKTPVWG